MGAEVSRRVCGVGAGVVEDSQAEAPGQLVGREWGCAAAEGL